MRLAESSHIWGPGIALLAYLGLCWAANERKRLIDIGNIIGAAFSVYGLAPTARSVWSAKASSDEWIKAIGLLTIMLIAAYPAWVVFQRLVQRAFSRWWPRKAAQ